MSLTSINNLPQNYPTNLSADVGESLVNEILNADQSDEPGIRSERKELKTQNNPFPKLINREAKDLLTVAEYLVKKSCLDHRRRRLGL